MAFMRKTKQELETALEKLEAAEARIQELEADVRALERVAGVMVLSPDGLIESVNDILLDGLGYQRDDLIGQHHRVLCDEEYTRSEDYIRFWRELVTGHTRQGRFERIHANGHRVWLEASYSPVMSYKGLSRRVITLVSDISEGLPGS